MTADLSRFAVGGAQRPDSFSGMRPELSSALSSLFQSAPPEIQQSLRITSGYRSPQRQTELYAAALKKYGSVEAARKWVAPPGRSQHNHGGAADLKYLSPAALDWAHANAGRFGLAFPLSNENWHVELAGGRDKGGASASPRSPSAGTLLSPVSIGSQTPPAGSTSRLSHLGDAVAPQPEPEQGAPAFNFDLGSVLANWQARRAAEAQAQAADQQRRAALFGGDLHDFFR